MKEDYSVVGDSSVVGTDADSIGVIHDGIVTGELMNSKG